MEQRARSILFFVLGIAVSIGALTIDLISPQGYTEWPLYIFPLIVVSPSNNIRYVTGIALLNSLFLTAGYLFPGSEQIGAGTVILHRLIGLLVIWIIWVYIHSQEVAKRKLQDLLAQRTKGQEHEKALAMGLKELADTLEVKVLERTAQVNSLSKALIIAGQRERRQFSQILHDDIQQILFAAKMRTELLALDGEANDELLQQTSELKQLIQKALDTSRAVALELNPPVLESEGLDRSLSWLVDYMRNRYGLELHTDIDSRLSSVPEAQRILIVQIARELLLNVVRHAHTRTVHLSGNLQDDVIMLRVADAGVGFDVQKARKRDHASRSMGLFSVEERLKLFGGELTIDSQPGLGTTVAVTLPVQE